MKLQTGAIAICPLWMILNTNIPSGALRFWLYLHAVHNQKRSDLSRADLSDLLDVTVDTIDRWIAVLKNEGCLRVIHNRTKGDGWLPNEYELIMVQGTHQATPEKIPLPSPDSGAKRPARSRARQAGLLYRDVQLDKNKEDRAIATELHPRFAAWWTPTVCGVVEAISTQSPKTGQPQALATAQGGNGRGALDRDYGRNRQVCGVLENRSDQPSLYPPSDHVSSTRPMGRRTAHADASCQ